MKSIVMLGTALLLAAPVAHAQSQPVPEPYRSSIVRDTCAGTITPALAQRIERFYYKIPMWKCSLIRIAYLGDAQRKHTYCNLLQKAAGPLPR